MILFGDTLGDPSMADGMIHVTNELKIGFLNYEVYSWFFLIPDFLCFLFSRDLSLIANIFRYFLFIYFETSRKRGKCPCTEGKLSSLHLIVGVTLKAQ